MLRSRPRSCHVAVLTIIVAIFATSCDNDFYLSEKEFYSLLGQVATADTANRVFSNIRGQRLEIVFDNSVSPPRVQRTNLAPFLRSNVPTLGILEGYPSFALSVDRVSGEVEAQFDNWIRDQVKLYTGTNNASVRLERVEAIRLVGLEDPAFTFSPDRMNFRTNVSIGVDCRIRIDALDPISNFLAGGVNGTYDFTISVREMSLVGEMSFAEAGSNSRAHIRIQPQPGNVVITDRGASSSSSVKDRLSSFVRHMLSSPIEDDLDQKYAFFALAGCQVRDEFRCQYQSRPNRAEPEIHSVVRGSDGHLYATFRRNGVWANTSQLKTEYRSAGRRRVSVTFDADPAIASSRSGAMYLASRTTGGGLYCAEYRDGWHGGNYLAPTGTTRAQHLRHKYVGRPAIVSTGAGNADVIASRADGTLVHIQRRGAGWSAPSTLQFPSGRTYRDPVAVVSDGRILVVAVADNGHVYTMVYDLDTGLWSQAQDVPTSEPLRFTPAVAASGDRQIDMVYAGNSGRPYHRTLHLMISHIQPNVGSAGVSYSQETVIDGNLTAQPALVTTGFHQLDLIARGTDNVLRYKHFTGPNSPHGNIFGVPVNAGWSGWRDMNQNFYGTQLLAGAATEDFAAVADGVGDVELVTRLRANTLRSNFRLHHNSFDAATFGRQPWKTVHWRGFQKIADPFIAGRPAIAVL